MVFVEVIYSGLIRTTTSCHSETYELAANTTLRDLLAKIIGRHGDDAARYLFSEGSLKLASGAIVLAGGVVLRNLDAIVAGKDTVKVLVMSPMMIGG